MKSVTLNGNEFTYDDQGQGPALLMLSGWCQDHRLFKSLAPDLAKDHRVIRLNWRGHGEQREVSEDFGADEQASDVIAFLDHMKIDRIVPVSTSHGGWANIELTDRQSPARIPQSVVIDWIMVSPDDGFFAMIDHIQDRANWERGLDEFFDSWIGDTDNKDIINHVRDEMAGFSFDMWARSGRVIAQQYRKWGSPMQRMAQMKQHRPITHIFSQPFEQEYHDAQKAFAADHPWFTPVKLQGKTHFPTLEQPAAVARTIREALAREADSPA